MSHLMDGTVLSNAEVTVGCYRMELHARKVAGVARPGQFLHVRCAGGLDPLLRRPLSICSADRRRGTVTLLYRVAGRGTAALALKKPGEIVNLIGPLGRGFTIPREVVKVAAVGGGIGVAPLFFLLQELAGRGMHADVFAGAAGAGQLLLTEEMKVLGHAVHLATDDGSAGYRGFVTDLFQKHYFTGHGFERAAGETARTVPGGGSVETGKSRPALPAFVYSCGPVPMMRQVAGFAASSGIPCEVSLEERMGCGVGACLACACKIKAVEGRFAYRRVCIDGPVFPAAEVVWE